MNFLSATKLIACLFVIAITGQALLSTTAEAQEPRWYPYVVARGPAKVAIQTTPMIDRPYRPMHFYGNTVRRIYYRGNPAPLPRDFARATSTVIFRR